MVFSFIETISNSGQRASQVVQNLRLFIREKRNTESGTVNIKSNIETVLNIFSHKIQNQVDLTVNLDPDIHVKGFDVRLFQLWSNLIKNALECMEGQNEKVLKLYSEVSPSSYAITVENNGPEIKGEFKRKIFNKFFTTKGKRNGSGMGLSIVKNVLEEHQGKIDLKSDVFNARSGDVINFDPIAYDKKNNKLVITDNNSIKIIDLNNEKKTDFEIENEYSSRFVKSMYHSPEILMTWSENGIVNFWNLNQQKMIRELRAKNNFHELSINQYSKVLLTGYYKEKALLFDLKKH